MPKKKLPQVSDDIRQLHADLRFYHAEDREWWKKFKVDQPEIGLRVYWYYKDEEQFFREEWGEDDGFDIRDYAQHSGILVPRPDVERWSSDVEAYMVCVDAYPCEKENPRIDWVSLVRVCDHPDVVEVFTHSEPNAQPSDEE